MKKGVCIINENGRRIVKGTGWYKPKTVNDLRELVKGSAKKYHDLIGFKFKNKEGKIICKTFSEFDKEIDFLGTALLSIGLKDKRISILSENRYEWGLCYFAVVNGTGVCVPLDKHLPQPEVENLISRGKVETIFYSPQFHEMMLKIASSNKQIKYYICMEKLPDVPADTEAFLSLPDLIEKGKALLSSGDKSFLEAPLDRNEMSVLLFTSGTTNISKGVMLSHTNLASNVSAITTVIKLQPGDVHLSLLPLHHTFENTIGLLSMIHNGVCIAYCEGLVHITKNIKEYNVSLLVAVPAIFEVMYKKIMEGIEKSGKTGLVKFLMSISDFLRKFGIDLRRVFFKSIFEQIGPKLRLAVSGAAPLDPKVVIGFEKLGLRLLQGYGLTETSPVVCTNNDFVNVPGSIGHPLAGIEVSIDNPDEDGIGEIITRGSNVMLGYFEDPEATRNAIDPEGWFKTGDLGTIDENGIVRITGRAKSMIVFANGKKGFPEEYEILLNKLPFVKDSYVWGHKTKNGHVQICAKLVLDKDKLLEEKGKFSTEEELSLELKASIDNINKTLPQYKIIRYFLMTWEDLVKTTTLKIKRSVEHEKTMASLKNLGLTMRQANGKFV